MNIFFYFVFAMIMITIILLGRQPQFGLFVKGHRNESIAEFAGIKVTDRVFVPLESVDDRRRRYIPHTNRTVFLGITKHILAIGRPTDLGIRKAIVGVAWDEHRTASEKGKMKVTGC